MIPRDIRCRLPRASLIHFERAGAGEDVPGFFWGAWVSACMGSLAGLGLIRGESNATPPEVGRAYLDRMEG